MSTSVNEASDALGMGPSAGYNLISVITALCVLIVSICMSCLHAVAFVSDIHMHIYVVTNLLMLYFWIKLIIKITKFLTRATVAATQKDNHNRAGASPQETSENIRNGGK